MMNREDKDSENKGQEEEDEEGEQKNRIRYANWTTHFLSLCIRSADGQFSIISLGQRTDKKFDVNQSSNHLTGSDSICTRKCRDAEKKRIHGHHAVIWRGVVVGNFSFRRCVHV
jgi:hypothetical protein